MKIAYTCKTRSPYRKLLAVAGLLLTLTSTTQAGQGPQPSICNRACWTARNSSCSTMSALNRGIIHHTAGAGEYTTSYETGKAKVRGVQNYHMDTQGWCDIGYHFLVNAGGHIYEGRKNSMTGLPRGAHDGCNDNSFGFNVMGYYHPPYNQTFTSASRASLEAVIAWRMPSSWSATGSGTYCGNSVGTLDGHYKVKSTACPGDGIIPSIPSIRTGVMNRKNGTSTARMSPSMFYDTGTTSMNIYRWSSSGSAFSSLTTASFSSFDLTNVGQHVAATDVNGDGKTDNVTAYQRTDGTMQLNVFLNGSSSAGIWFESGTFNMANVNGRMVGGDFNGDGRGDVAMLYQTGTSSFTIFRFLSTGSSFTYASDAYPASYALSSVEDHAVATDVNDDGKADIVTAYQVADGTMRLHVFFSGSGAVTASTWFTSGAFTMANVAGRMVAGDFDGNGKGDVAMMYSTGTGSMNVYRFLSTGSAFNYTAGVYPAGYSLSNVGKNVAAGDADGDGKSDIVTAYQYPDGTMQLHVFYDGNGGVVADSWFQSGSFGLSNVAGRMTMGSW
jgi:hypothetical protein